MNYSTIFDILLEIPDSLLNLLSQKVKMTIFHEWNFYPIEFTSGFFLAKSSKQVLLASSALNQHTSLTLTFANQWCKCLNDKNPSLDTQVRDTWDTIVPFSSYIKLLKAITWVKRFCTGLTLLPISKAPLYVIELSAAYKDVVKLIQKT